MVSEIERIGRQYVQDNPQHRRRAEVSGQAIANPFSSPLLGIRSQGAETSSGVSSGTGKAVGSVAPKGVVEGPQEQPPQPDLGGLFDMLDDMGDRSGGGSRSASATQAAGVSAGAGLGPIQQAQAQAAQQLGQLESQFNQRRAELAEQYQLAETPEEKARIQFLLGDIEEQRDAGQQIIETVYTDAIEDAAARAEAQRGRAVEAGQRADETFAGAAEDTAELMAAINQEFGGGLGVAGEAADPDATQRVADIRERGAEQAQFAERMGELTAEDIDFLGQAMEGERGAQVGDLQRMSAALSARAQMEHDQQVQQRIQQERAEKRQMIQNLQQMYDQQAMALGDRQAQLASTAAQIQAQNARTSAQLRDSAMARQAQQAQQGPSWADQQRFELAAQEAARQFDQDQREWDRRQAAEQQQQVFGQLGQLSEDELADLALRSQVAGGVRDAFGGFDFLGQ